MFVHDVSQEDVEYFIKMSLDVSNIFWSFVFQCKDYIDDSTFESQEYLTIRDAVLKQQMFFMSYDSLFITHRTEEIHNYNGIYLDSYGIHFCTIIDLFEITARIIENVELRQLIQCVHKSILDYLQQQEDFEQLTNLKLT
jgi:hypothetical protein